MDFDKLVLSAVRIAGAFSIFGLLGLLPTETGHADPEWMSYVGLILWVSTELDYWAKRNKK